MKMDKPTIIEFPKIGSSELGYITIAEAQKNIPFDIKRVYWTYFTPQDVVRGGHAHKNLEQVIFAEAIWRAFAQCFLTHDEAVQAIDDYGRGLLHNAEVSGRAA